MTVGRPDTPMGTTYGCAFLRNDETLHIYILAGGLEHEWIMDFLLGISSSQPTKSYFSRWLKPPTSLPSGNLTQLLNMAIYSEFFH